MNLSNFFHFNSVRVVLLLYRHSFLQIQLGFKKYKNSFYFAKMKVYISS
jgi:hypothetical protein